jgi:spore coat protein A
MMRSLLVCLLCLLALPAAGDVVQLTPAKDNTLYAPYGYLSNAKGIYLFVGTNANNESRRALMQFDLGAIPPGSTITGVELRLFMNRTIAGEHPIYVHRLHASWGEGTSDANGQEGSGGIASDGDATWEHRFYPDTLWGTIGGDYEEVPSGQAPVDADIGNYTWTSTPELVSDVQSWLDAPSSNHGWILIGKENVSPTAKRFHSRENGSTSNRPRLTVTYTPPAGATGACCIAGSCVIRTAADCAAQGGVYQGDAVPCTQNTCGASQGACCLVDGTCVQTTQADCTSAAGTYQGDGTPCSPGACAPVLVPFVDALPIPAIAQPVTGQPGGQAHYAINIRQVRQKLHRDLPLTTVWGYDGLFPGPTIEASVGQPVTVHWINDLRDESDELLTEHALHADTCLHGPDHFGQLPRTVTHLHGGHVDSISDGQPERTQLPGESSELYEYPNNQRAATIWYHDHALGITRLNVYMGLAGFYLLRDPAEAALNLPAGAYEIPLAIQDRSFNADGSFRYDHDWHEHFFGDVILVNGAVWPFLNVERGKYRLRLLNGSGSRTYNLSLSNGGQIVQIGTEGGLLEAPVTLSSVLITPGERVDVVIDFAPYAPGTEIILLNDAPSPYPGTPGVGVVPNVMKFIVGSQTGHTAPIPATLSTIEPLHEEFAREHRDFILRKVPDSCTGDKWLINDLGWDDITEFPILGTTEVWSFINRSGVSHPMHVHLVGMQILDYQPFAVVDGEIVPTGPRVLPPAHERGWKDTVRVDPQTIARVIMRFESFTGRFPYHCHVLEHEDHEMMRQFEVVICPGDFNSDGGVDGQDVEAFFMAWEASDDLADVNRDGGVDGADVEAFFLFWEAGGC